MNDHYQTLILGGGLSGLTIAHKLRLHDPKHRFLILEKKGRTGGVIKTYHDQGYLSEIGPHGFLDNCRESKELLSETGLDRECIKAPLSDFVRYVYVNGKLNLIPQTPGKILMAPLIGWPAKLRVLTELWQPPLKGEPTVAKWVSHRFGPALLPYLDAVYTGTYAGDFDRLTIDSVMPGARGLEKEYGSVLRGLLAKQWQKKRSRSKGRKGGFTMPAMTSFPAGMQRLPQRLAENLVIGRDLLLNTSATGLSRNADGWRITTDTSTFTAKNVVAALPINTALRLLGPIAPELPVKSVPQSWISSVIFGFTADVSLPPGFGFLTPEQEQRFSLGTLFSSNMFPGRAPDGHIVFETLVGGRRHPERAELDDRTLIKKTLEDVQEILAIKKQPVYTTVLRSDGGIPQLEKNYPLLLAWRDMFIRSSPGLHICGFGWDGIGLNDMMKYATRVSEDLLAATSRAGTGPEVKGVYF